MKGKNYWELNNICYRADVYPIILVSKIQTEKKIYVINQEYKNPSEFISIGLKSCSFNFNWKLWAETRGKYICRKIRKMMRKNKDKAQAKIEDLDVKFLYNTSTL